jgi:hypothetical protein
VEIERAEARVGWRINANATAARGRSEWPAERRAGAVATQAQKSQREWRPSGFTYITTPKTPPGEKEKPER